MLHDHKYKRTTFKSASMRKKLFKMEKERPSKYLQSRRISLQFCKDVRNDIAKRLLILAKIMLEGMNLWPGKDSLVIKLINYVFIINLTVMEVGHLFYTIYVITDVMKMAIASTTVVATFQGISKMVCLRYYKRDFNEILVNLWTDFWPTDLANTNTQNIIKKNVFCVKFICLFYFIVVVINLTQYVVYPLLIGNNELPFTLLIPFKSYKNVPYFEMIYLWQYFTGYINILVIFGYDFLFCAIGINIVAQFQILQDVVRNIYVSKTERDKKKIYEKLGIKETFGRSKESELLKKCIDHHNCLLQLCKRLEYSTSTTTFIQFFVSSSSLCVSSLVLTFNPTEMSKMVPFIVAHLMQLFIMCAIGSELMHQSVCIADAAVECGYHYKFEKDVREGIVMIVQRSQKEVKLTGLGFAELSFASFLMLLRATFSFYTLLDSLK